MDVKNERIREFFLPVIGAKLLRYETAELQLEDGSWDVFNDLPIRMFFDSEIALSVAWSQYDELWLSNRLDLPFDHGSTIRWITNSPIVLNNAIGKTLDSVMLGQGEMSVEGKDIEIWTRLILKYGDIWVEIFNALDENGYDSHTAQPIGTFINCV